MAKNKTFIDPLNVSNDPQHSIFFFDENSPNKTKNANKEEIWVGDDVYFQGGNGKLQKLIQIGVGPDDFMLAEVKTPSGKTVRLGAKGCYKTKLDSLFQNNGLAAPIIIAILFIIVIILINQVVNYFDNVNFVLVW